MKPNPVVWFEIYVQDMERAKKFYESVFQTKLEKLENPEIEMLAFPMEKDAPGAGGSLVKMPGFPPNAASSNSVLIYFSCDDCAVEEARVKESGGRIEKTKFSIGPYGFISLVYDTEGNMVGLHSLK